MKNRLNNQSGMTLIEILIAMAILAAITLSTTTSLRSSVTLKKKIKGKIDRQAKFRSALRIIDRDIRMAFHHRDITLAIYKDIKEREKEILASNNNTTDNSNSTNNTTNTGNTSTNTNTNTTANTNTNTNTENLTLINLEKYQREITDPTTFYGEKNELHFTNTNSVRVTADDLASSQQEVGYYVKNCRNRLDPELSYNCLWRRVSKVIDDKVQEGGEEFVVLENVTVFKLRYYGETKDDWIEQWFTGERADDDTKDRFPEAVEVSIAFKEGDKVEEAVMISHIAFPNNEVISEGDRAFR